MITALLLVLTALASSEEPPAAGAQAQAQTVNVVFAIDNSGSMRGIGGDPASDPENRRLSGVRQLVTSLRALLASSTAEREVLLGAVSFGADVEVLSPLVDVRDPSLDASLRPDERDGTDFVPALCAAWATVTRQAPPGEAGCDLNAEVLTDAGVAAEPTTGRHIVVLLTDGSPTASGDELDLDGVPAADQCGGLVSAGSALVDGDASLCRTGDTWRALNAAVATDLVVIGLDEPDRWFTMAEAYWKRAVACDEFGDTQCGERVVRAVHPDQLARFVLRTFVEICDRVASVHTCQVPGGLTSLGLLVSGLDASSVTRVSPPGEPSQLSDAGAAALDQATGSLHSWRFDAPRGGAWSVEASLSDGTEVFVEFEVAPFEADLDSARWDVDGFTATLTPLAPLDLASADGQPYIVELQQGGEVIAIDAAPLVLSGAFFAVQSRIGRPAPGGYELVFYLDAGSSRIEAARVTVSVEEIVAAPAPPQPAVATTCTIDSIWSPSAPSGTTSSYRFGIRAGIPLSFRVPTPWDVTLTSSNCEHEYDVTATVRDAEALDDAICAACANSTLASPLPLTLSLLPGGALEGEVIRRVHWVDTTARIEDTYDERIQIADSLLMRTEPAWRWIPNLALLLLGLAAAAALNARSPQRLPDGRHEAPVHLGLADGHGWVTPIVVAGVFTCRRIEDGARPPRYLTQRFLVGGPLRVRTRDTTDAASVWRELVVGRELDDRTARLLVLTAPSRSR